APWNVTATDGSAHTISAAVAGTEISVTIDGASQSRTISSVSALTVTGGDGDDSFTIDASLASASLSINFVGGGGTDTLHGPAADTTWTVGGADSGALGNLAFTGFANLV